MKAVTDNPGASRYELRLDDELVAFVRYRDTGELVDLVHTETAAGYEGRGLAATLIAGVLDDLRGKGRKLRPSLPRQAPRPTRPRSRRHRCRDLRRGLILRRGGTDAAVGCGDCQVGERGGK